MWHETDKPGTPIGRHTRARQLRDRPVGGAWAKIVEFGYDVTGISYTQESEHATRDFFTMVLQTNVAGGRKIDGTCLPLEKSIAGYPSPLHVSRSIFLSLTI